MKKVMVFALVMILALLAACGNDEEETDTKDNETKSNEDQRTVEIEDAMGKQTIEGTPEKVVALEWSFAENLLALGVQPVGVADMDGFNQWVNIEKSFDDRVKDVGTRAEPNLEAISRLNPDLIIAVKFRHEQYLDKLKDIAPVVMFAPYGEEESQAQYQSMLDNFDTLAKVMDKQDEAEQAKEELTNVLDEQKSRVKEAGLDGANYLATQVFTAKNSPTIRLFTDNSMVSQVMAELSFTNAYQTDELPAYGFDEVSIETLQNFQDKNPQFLYIAQEDDDIFENQLKGNPAWENLSFVEKGNVHKLPGDTWTFGGVYSAEVLAKQLADAMVKE